MTTTTLPSLGQSAHLGSLYDARNNRFFAGAIVFSNPPETDVIPSESRRIELTIVTSDTTSEKCKSLNCDAELSAGILSHAIPVEGSAKFLLFNRNANNASTASIVCQIRWMNETLKYLGLNEECVKREIIEGTKATHVVVGIEWGVNAILKVSYSATSNDSGADAKAKVKAQLSFIKANLEGNAGAANMQKESSKNMEFSLYADAEIDTLLPTTADEALDAIRKVAKYKPTNGKGTQLKYVLAPIDDIRRHYKIAGVSQVAHGLNMKIVQRAIDILNKYEASEQKLGDFLETITTNDEFTPHAVLSEAQSTLKNLENGQSHFRVDLRAKMFDCKTDKKNEADFEKLIESAEKYYEELKIQPFLSANEQLIVKFAYVRELKMQNVTVIGNNPGGRNFDQVHRENSGGKEYALFFDFGERGTKAYEDNVMLFNKTVCEAASGGEKIACVAVDLQVVTSDLPDAIRSLALSEQPQQRTRIFYSDNGRVITQNFAASEKYGGGKSFLVSKQKHK